jgi:hypothetical protein
MSRFTAVKAQRIKLKARIGLTGVTNGGKTYSALMIAKGLLQAENAYTADGKLDWSKVAVIDTERRRSLFYADIPEFGQFQFIEFTPPYHPKDYMEAVNYAVSLGAEVIIIDSISHAWNGTGGILDIVRERTENSRSKNSFSDGWGGRGGGTELQNQFIDTILSTDAHIIATFRQKMEYVIERDEAGKTKITKLGTKPQQKDDLEYEFDITLKLDNDHYAEIIKNTVKFLDGQGTILEPITESFGKNLGDYLASGKAAETITQEQIAHAKEIIKDYVTKNPSLKEIFKLYSNKSLKDENDLKILNEIIKNMKEC